jgi:tripartite-type tricarboxylate transporter receptor subunit TctC
VPYKGVAPAMNAVVAGEVNVIFVPPTVAMPLVEAGKLRALAFTGAARFPRMPQLPTMAEAGVPNFELAGVWHGWFAPAKTPPAIVARLQSEVRKALQVPKVRDFILVGGYEPDGRSPEAFRQLVKAEFERYAEMVQIANIPKE